MSTNIPKGCILLFDGACNLCNGTVRFIIKRDPEGKIQFASLQSASGQAILKKLNLPTNNFDSFVYISNGDYFLKSSAGLRLLKDLDGIWKLCYAFIVFPKFLRDPIYSIISKNRYRIFGKTNNCLVPTPEIIQRFLR